MTDCPATTQVGKPWSRRLGRSSPTNASHRRGQQGGCACDSALARARRNGHRDYRSKLSDDLRDTPAFASSPSPGKSLGEFGERFTVDYEDLECDDEGNYQQLDASRIVSLIWNGMRKLPYTNLHIARAIASYLALKESDLLTLHGPGTIGIEFSGAGARGRAIVSTKLLTGAVRPDIFDLLKSEEGEKIRMSSISMADELLRRIIVPSKLFDFRKLVDMFADEVIPSQASIRLYGDMIIFSPYQIDVLGQD